ncbi:MAG: proline dehydrogenase family protein [Longimicrobiaceae bacterium]
MFRQTLLYLSGNPAARRLVTGTPVARKIAGRFVAGDRLDQVLTTARALNRGGLTVSLDYLGESVTSRDEATAATSMAVRTLEGLTAQEVDGNISIKPSQLGLDVDERFCRDNLARVLERARELGDGGGEVFVRLDMESSDYTERTIALVERLWEDGFRNLGTVLQSYLRRTPDDLERLLSLGSRVRLVKGAYRESGEVAFADKPEVDRMFVDEMKTLLERGNYPAIATHDEEIIAATRRFAFEHGVRTDSFEFQMLYGVRRDLQRRLREEGYNVRVYVPFGDSWYPYLMRRMAERPANLFFVVNSVVRESPLRRVIRPVALGAGAVAGALGARAWRGRRDGGR